MLYFSIVSSSAKCMEYELEVNEALKDLKAKLSRLVEWENQFNREIKKDKQADHQELLDVVTKYCK